MAHVEKRSRNGKTTWRARYRKPNGREASRTFERKSDATRFLNEIEVAKAKGLWIDPRAGKVLFQDWSAECLAARIDLRPSSKARDDAYVRGHLLPRFGDVPLSGIERADVQEWVNDLSDSLAPATVRACHRLLSGMLAEAVEARIIGQSPCRTIRLPRIQRTEQRFLTADQVEQLAEAIGHHYGPLVLSAAYLGARWGELAGLQRNHLNVLRREVAIVGTLEEVKGHLNYVTETKTSASRRRLTFPPFLGDVLGQHLEGSRSSEGYVFTGRDGAPLRRSNFRRRHWKPALERAGLDTGTRFHDLRHTHASFLIEAGAHPKEIQDRLGHASITTTLNVYGHLMPGLGARLDDALEATRRDANANLPRPHRGPTVLSVVAEGRP